MQNPFSHLKEKWDKDRESRVRDSARIKQLIRDRGTSVFKKYGIAKAVIFGSLAEERYSQTSDIDILVKDLSNEKYWEFRRELEEALDIPVDLYTDKDDPNFVTKILSRGELIYEV
jgi:predicted nucleotidyltransferase